MKKLLSLLTVALLLPLVMVAQTLAPNQKLLGHYTTDDILTGSGWGMSMLNGVRPIATDLTPDELALFQGSKIVAFRIGLAQSTPVTRVFVIPIDRNGNLGTETEWECNISDEGWNVVTVDNPYLINLPADYQLRIGFDYEQTRTNKPISAVKVGTVYPSLIYRNGSWNNFGVNTYGNLSVQLICENDNFPTHIIRLRNLTTKAMIKVGDPMQVKFQTCNLGISQVGAGQCTYNIAIDGEIVGTTTNPVALSNEYTNVECTVSTSGLSVGEHTLTVTAAIANGETLDNPAYVTTTFSCFENGFTRQMHLIEQFTSTYCTYCPLGNGMLTELINMRDDIAWVGIHGNMQSGTDPMSTVQGDTIMAYLGVDSYPSGSFDRSTGWEDDVNIVAGLGYNEQYHQQVAAELGQFFDHLAEVPSFATININSTYDAGTRQAVITIDGEITPDFDEMMGADSKLTVYITEDGITARQLNQGTWVNNYVHNGVFRVALNSAMGNNLSRNGNTYKNEFTYTIPSSWNAEKLNVVAFISRPMTNGATGVYTNMYVNQANKRKLGEFDEPASERGDVNGDGLVNMTDISVLIDYILTGNPDGVDLVAADCNLDGSIAITDVTLLVDYLLWKEWP